MSDEFPRYSQGHNWRGPAASMYFGPYKVHVWANGTATWRVALWIERPIAIENTGETVSVDRFVAEILVFAGNRDRAVRRAAEAVGHRITMALLRSCNDFHGVTEEVV